MAKDQLEGQPPLSPAEERNFAERLLIWLLRKWWALAVIVIGGALTNQFGAVVQTIFAELLKGQSLSFGAVQTSWQQTLDAFDPVRGGIIFGAAILITVLAYLADRAESARERRVATRYAALRQQEQRADIRQTTEEIVKEVFRSAARGELDEEDLEDGEAGGAMRQIALPPRPALVVGREVELDHIATLLTTDGSTTVALRGMGGVGKSTLLAESLYRCVEAKSFVDGVIWIPARDLEYEAGEEQIYDAVANALGRNEVTRARGTVAKSSALRRALTGRRLLIGLDNVEQQLPLDRVVATLTPLNAAGIGPKILLTTRTAVADINGVREIDLDVLTPEQGLTLLQTLLQRSNRPLAAEDEPAARAIVNAIGALPLAIELVAPRIARRAEPIAALALRLQDDGGVQLRGGARGIERTFADTYSQLRRDEQEGFSALAVFAGTSFSQEAALAAMHALVEDLATPQMLLDLSDLSLLRELPQADSEPPRYQMHPLLRQYARERLHEQGAATEQGVELATARYYRALVHRYTRRGGMNLRALDGEYTNVAGAITWAHQQMVADPNSDLGREAMQILGDLCGALKQFFNDFGYWADGRRFLQWGIAADRRMGNHRREATLLVQLAFIVRQQGDLDEAERYYREALDLARSRGDRLAEAARIQNLGTVALYRQQYDRARTLYEESLALRRETQDKGGQSAVLRALGTLAAEQGRLDEARQYLREAIDLFAGRKHDIAFARTLRELAAVYIRDPQGDRPRARQLLEEALGITRRHTQLPDEAAVLEWLGTLDLLEEHPDDARTHWLEALTIYQRLGSSAAAEVRERLARIDAAVGKAPAAVPVA